MLSRFKRKNSCVNRYFIIRVRNNDQTHVLKRFKIKKMSCIDAKLLNQHDRLKIAFDESFKTMR